MIQVFFIAGFSFLCTIPLLFLSCFHQHLDDTATQSTMQSECRLVFKIMPAFPTAPPDESENYRDKEKDLLWFMYIASWCNKLYSVFSSGCEITLSPSGDVHWRLILACVAGILASSWKRSQKKIFQCALG